jgi:hypothetical protein
VENDRLDERTSNLIFSQNGSVKSYFEKNDFFQKRVIEISEIFHQK